MKQQFVNSITCLVLAGTMLAAASSHACFMHFGSGGGFYSPDRTALPPSPVQLFSPPMITAVPDKPQEVAVRYQVPESTQAVSLRVKTTDNVVLMNGDIHKLTNVQGSTTIQFKVAGSGNYSLFVTIEGTNNGQTITNSKNIYIYARPEA